MSPSPLLNSSSTTEPSSTTMASISMGTVSSFTAVTATATGGGGGPLGGDQILEYILIGAGCGIGLLLCLISTLCIGICCLSLKSKHQRESVLNMEIPAVQEESEFSNINFLLEF